jgi:hypothetical protein
MHGVSGGFLALVLAMPLDAQVTESPFTVAPGRVLVEMDGLRFAVDRDSGSRFTGLAVASTLLSAGITSYLDVQAGVDLFLKETYRVGGSRDSQSGIGDLAFRMKWTVWRDDSRGAGLALIPYVKIPSGTGRVGSDAMEGGLIMPWAMKLRTGAIVGAMFQWDLVRNDDENGYDGHWHTSAYIEQTLVGGLAVYGEATAIATSTGLSKSTGTIGIGGRLRVAKNIELDYELQRGVSNRSTDWMHALRVNWEW